MATARPSELPVIIVSGADSPRSRIGRGLESIGGMTAETLQRISTAVGGVIKSPVVLMTKVGGLASPRAATLPAPPGSSLEERVYHLEIQMKSLEERFNSMTVVTELDLTTHSHKEKPRMAKSLLQDMETDRTLVKRVQMLENGVNERMQRFEKALSSIQSRLDHIELSRHESVAGFERQEMYYDAEQQSDNFGEAGDQNFHDVPGEATGGSPTHEKSRVKETSSAAPTTSKHVEPLQETDAGENDDFSDPQVVSTPVYSKEAFLTQPMKHPAPSSEPAESVHRGDASCVPASSEQQLASTLEELHGSFVTESSAAAASAKFLEIARSVTAEKSTLAHASSEPQSTSAFEEPREAFPAAVLVVKSEEHAQEDADDKSGTATFEATQKDFTKEPLADALDSKIAQELATQGVVIIALPSSEPLMTSKSLEEPSVAVPSANSEEPAQEDTGDKSDSVTAARESPKEDFVKESSTSAPVAGPAHEPSSQEDSSKTSDTAIASSESPVAFESMEEPSTTDPGANFEEPGQADAAGKSGDTIAGAELPSAPSLEEPHEESVKEVMADAPNAESKQVLTTQDDNDMQVASPASQMASKLEEEPSTVAPSADSEEPAQEDVADKTGTTMEAPKSSLASSSEEPKGGIEKESMASAPSGEPAQEHSDMAIANSGEREHKADVDESGTVNAIAESALPSFDDPQEDFESQMASKLEEEPSAVAPSADSEELAQEDVADKTGTTMEASKSSLASPSEEPKEGIEKESMAFAPSGETAQEDVADKTGTTMEAPKSSLASSSEEPKEGIEKESMASAPSGEPAQEQSDMAIANSGEHEHKADVDESGTVSAIAESALPSSDDPQEDFESQTASKLEEEPSAVAPRADSEEPAQEAVADKTGTTMEAPKSSLASSSEEAKEGFEKESMASAPSGEPAQEHSDMASANSGERERKADANESGTFSASAESPLASSDDRQEDFEKESSATTSSAEPAQETATQEDSSMAFAPPETSGKSKYAEDPSTVESVGFEEPAHEDVDKDATTTTATDSPSPIPHQDPQEDFEESLATTPSIEPIHEPSSLEDSGATGDKSLASSEAQVASEFAEEPSSNTSTVNSEEPAHEDGAVKSDTVIADAKSPSVSSFEEPHEEKESVAAVPSTEPAHELATQEDTDMAPFEPLLASKLAEEPSSNISKVNSEDNSEESAHEDVDKGVARSTATDSPSPIPSQDPQEDFEKESSAAAPSTEPIHEPSSLEDSGATSDKSLASSEPQVASEFAEEMSSNISNDNSEEPAHEDDAKGVAKTTATDSLLPIPHQDPQEDFEKESSAAAPSTEPIHEPSSLEDSGATGDKSLASSEPQVTSKLAEEPSSNISNVNSEEPAHEDDAKGVAKTTATDSLLPIPHQDPQEDFEKESSAAAPSTEPIHEPSSLEDSGATGDKSLASSEPQVTSKLAEEPSSNISNVNSEEPAHEDDAKGVATTTATDSPSPIPHQDPQEDFEKESSAAAPSTEPSHEPSSLEDSGATGDKSLASSEPQVTSKLAEEPSSNISNVNSEEPAHEDDAKGVAKTTARDSPSPIPSQDPQEDFEQESSAAAPSTEPIHEPSSLEDSGATGDKSLASSEPHVASKLAEERSSNISNVNSEEPAHEDDAKGVAKTTATDSPLPIAHQDPQEDFEKESLAAAPSTEPSHEPSSLEDSGATGDKSLASSEPQVTSKLAEEPSSNISNVNSEEPAHEDVDKGVATTTARDSPSRIPHQDPQEDFEKESLAAAPSTEPSHEPSSLEDSGTASDKSLASSEPQVTSKFAEEPSSNISNDNSEEPAYEDVDKGVNTTTATDSPLPIAHQDPQEDFEQESSAAAPSTEPIHEPSSPEDSGTTSDKSLTSFETQVASEFAEEPSSNVSNVNSEEPALEDGAVKSDTMIADAKSPSVSSFEEPHEEKESMAAVPSTEPAQELATPEDSDMTPFEPQVASKLVEEPSSNVSKVNSEEHAHENIGGKSGFETTAIESPSMSSLEAHNKDHRKESLEAGASAKILEPTEEDESGESPIAFAPLEIPSSSFFGIPQEASSKEPSEASVQPRELAQEKSGTVPPSADLPLTSTEEEDNRATKESEYKLAEDFKVHPQHIPSTEKEFPRNQSNLAHVSSEESFATEDSDDRVESDQSGEKFFDVENDIGDFEPWESDEPGEATGTNAVAQEETQVPESSLEPKQAPVREPAQELEQAPAKELEQEPVQAPAREPQQEHDQAPERELEQEPDQAPAQELEQDHESVEQAHAQEHEQQPAQETEQEDLTRNSALALPPSESQATSKPGESQELLAEEPLAAAPSTKFEEPRQANAVDESGTHDLPLTSTTEEPEIESVGSLEKSLSSASFQQSGNPEHSENLEHESSDTPGTSSTPRETLARETSTAAPTTEIAQGHDAGKSDNRPEESKEAFANEPVKAESSSESTGPAQEVGDGLSGAWLASLEPQLIPTLEEPEKGFLKEPSADAESTSKSADLEDSRADEPSTATSSAKLAQESDADKTSAKGKHVKIIAEPTEEIPSTQSDSTHDELNPEATEDTTKLESQGSFLAFGADSKEALAKEPWPSAKLLELFEEENNSGERGPVLADSPMTSTVEEPQKPRGEELLASAKSVPKGHARRRGFVRSSSEPQFAYKLEEHRKALAKESSVAAIPSASKLGEEHAQEEFGDTQCLPFRILGEGKHPRKESESKSVEDVKSPATKSESSPYVLEPRPSKIKLKKKKEKKEKKPDAAAEEKERRLSLGSGEMERKSSLRAEEKDSKYSPRAEEKHRQPFRHLRDRLRHAFSVNKEP